MRKIKLLLLALLLTAIPNFLWAYTKDQVVPLGDAGYYYKVLSVDGVHKLMFLGVDKKFTGGAVNIPGEFNDGKGTSFIVTEIGSDNTVSCKNVTGATLPETIEKLNASCFPDAQIDKINIPKKVSFIAPTVWKSMDRNPECKVDAENPNFESDNNGALYTKGKKELRSVPSNVQMTNGTYTVDAAVKSIGLSAFYSTKDLKKIVLPAGLEKVAEGWPSITPTKTLEEFAIAGGGTTPNYEVIDGVLFTKGHNKLVLYPESKSGASYTVPKGTKEIASYAIVGNKNMTSIDLNEVEKVAVSTLVSLDNLTTVKIPKSLKKAGMAEGAFESLRGLQRYEVAADHQDFAADNGVLLSANKDILYSYPLAKPDVSYTIPTTVKTIGVKAFMNASILQSLEIPGNVESINEQAFRRLINLTSVKFVEPSKLTKLTGYEFWQCPKLEEVTLPASLTEIGNSFLSCDKLRKINVSAGSKLKTIKESAFASNTKLEEFNFLGSSELTTIEENAFANAEELKSIKLPKTIKDIKRNAFRGCAKLAHVEIDPTADIDKIGAGAFADCGLQDFTVPKNVKAIEREAFSNCLSLKKVDISEKTTEVSPEAFKYCDNLTNINVSKKHSKYSSVDGYLLSKDKETLLIFPPGKANDRFTLLPPSIKTIGDYSFLDCRNLKNVTIPNLVTSIGKRAFGLCKNLNTITFLCDAKILSSNINQNLSEKSFDDGTEAPNMFKNIDINVREGKLTEYQNDEFYKKFKSISPSFKEGTEEYIAVSDNAVDLLSTTREDYTFVLPTTVTHNSKTYMVSLIGDYAFQKVTNKVKEVVVKKNVEYVGAKAFMTDIKANTSTVQSIFFIEGNPTKQMLSTTRFELDETGNDYREIATTTKIYVKKNALDKYKTEWHKKVYDKDNDKDKESPFNFVKQLEYKIPGVKITKKYGTFAREFDADLGIYYKENHKANIGAFVAKNSDVKQGPGDYGTSKYHVSMTSVDVNGGVTGRYGYVPENTGALIKVLDLEATPDGFYYAIGEEDAQAHTVTNNIMTGITVNPQKVDYTASGDPMYVMQGGLFQKVTQTIPTFPIHKAYAKISSVPAGAKISFSFWDDNSATGITAVETEKEADKVYYNLNGQRVEKPQRGVYIQGGRKVVVK